MAAALEQTIDVGEMLTAMSLTAQALINNLFAVAEPALEHHPIVGDNQADGKVQWIVYEQYFYWLTNNAIFRDTLQFNFWFWIFLVAPSMGYLIYYYYWTEACKVIMCPKWL